MNATSSSNSSLSSSLTLFPFLSLSLSHSPSLSLSIYKPKWSAPLKFDISVCKFVISFAAEILRVKQMSMLLLKNNPGELGST